MKLAERILDILGLEFVYQEEKEVLDQRIYLRVTENEKILIQKYCQLKGTDTSKFVRNLIFNEIDTFIQNKKVNFKDVG